MMATAVRADIQMLNGVARVEPRCPECNKRFGDNIHENSSADFSCNRGHLLVKFTITRLKGLDIQVTMR